MKDKNYIVTFPFILEITTSVTASTEKEAIDRAIQNCDLHIDSTADYAVISGGPMCIVGQKFLLGLNK